MSLLFLVAAQAKTDLYIVKIQAPDQRVVSQLANDYAPQVAERSYVQQLPLLATFRSFA